VRRLGVQEDNRMSQKGKKNLTFVLGSAAPILLLLSILIVPVSSDGGMYSSQFATSSPSREVEERLVHERTTPAYDPAALADLPVALDTNRCKPNTSYVWCLPSDYNQEKHPFTYFYMVNKSLPWDYEFRFVIEEISNINDKAQTMSVSMYFAVSWLEPRLQINESAPEWSEDRTGPQDQVNESPDSLKYIWYPELEIYGLEIFGRQRVLKEMSGVRIRKNKTINYELGVRVTISCRMNFDDYPLDAHTCQFQVGSYYDTFETVTCKSHLIYNADRQRSLQHFIEIEDLPESYGMVKLPSGLYAACGFQVRLQRKKMQYIVQVYLPTSLFVIVSWVSFLIKPEVVPGRMALLVTLFLVLINIFNSVREQAPISSRLNAVDLYLVVCIFLVFGALLEYAVILLLLKKRRKPRRTIDEGLKTLFNGEVTQPLESPRRRNANFSQRRDEGEEGEEMENGIPLEDLPPLPRPTPTQKHKHQPMKDVPLSAHKQALCDNIDNWTMWLSPPIFVGFNVVYWIAYRHVESSAFL